MEEEKLLTDRINIIGDKDQVEFFNSIGGKTNEVKSFIYSHNNFVLTF